MKVIIENPMCLFGLHKFEHVYTTKEKIYNSNLHTFTMQNKAVYRCAKCNKQKDVVWTSF